VHAQWYDVSLTTKDKGLPEALTLDPAVQIRDVELSPHKRKRPRLI
jgi:hypothetical protein